MTDIIDVENSLRAVLAEGSGIDLAHIYPGNDGPPRGKDVDTYITFLLIDDQPTGGPSYTQLYGGDAGETPAGTLTETWRHAVYSVQFYRGRTGRRAAQAFASWCETETGLDYLQATDPRIEVVQPVTVGRADTIIEEDWEQRGLINLTIEWVDSRIDPSGRAGDDPDETYGPDQSDRTASVRGSLIGDFDGARLEKEISSGS